MLSVQHNPPRFRPQINDLMSSWAGLISGRATSLVSLCCIPGEFRLGLYSTFTPPTSAIVYGLSLGRTQPENVAHSRLFKPLFYRPPESESNGRLRTSTTFEKLGADTLSVVVLSAFQQSDGYAADFPKPLIYFY